MSRKLMWWCTAVLALASAARADLHSDELLLIYNANSRDSKELAEYYAERRSVPAENMIGVDVPLGEDMLRADYDAKLVEPVRRYIWDRDLITKIRCLVTFYDIPLRVGEKILNPREQKQADWIKRQRDQALAGFHRAINDLHALVEGVDPEKKRHVKRKQTNEDELRKAFAYYRQMLSARLGRLEEQDAAERRMKFLPIALEVDGLRGAGWELTTNGNLADDAVMARLRELLEEVADQDESGVFKLLAGGRLSPQYREGIRGLRRWRGLAAAFGRLDKDSKALNFKLSDAAVDSELALLWWRPYRLVKPLFNYRGDRVKVQATDEADRVRQIYAEYTLMTCRLDGPSPEVVRRMIDDSIAVEKEGLEGTVYLDRDPTRRRGEYEWQERALDQAGTLIGRKTNLPVIVETTKELFKPGECPGAALYCGWYSLMEYVDAFDFVRGAVAYHIASGEAMSLRDPVKTYWCRELLLDGVAATLGPVAEPYVRAVPKPDEFFGLLLTGEYPLAEAFTLANPYVSWRVIVLGDPLYNPFKNNPRLVVEDVLLPSWLPLDHSLDRYRPLPKGPEDLTPWPIRNLGP